MDAGSTFQPAGTCKATSPANLSAEAITRTLIVFALTTENKDRTRQLDKCRWRDDERLTHLAGDPIHLAKPRFERIGDLFAADLQRHLDGKRRRVFGRPISVWSATA